jgi:peptidoglycan/LPS O-acetylase OafA/YrhL
MLSIAKSERSEPPRPNLPHGQLEEATMTRRKRAFSQWLDLFRWIAALLVVINHCSNRFLVRITDVDAAHRSIPFYLFAFFGGLGREAVMVFFVLSGYLVGGGLWRDSRRSGTPDIAKYLIKRLSRLCIVVYPTLLLVILLNLTGIFVFKGVEAGVYPQNILHTMHPAGLACNAAFLQTAICKPYGDDNALWSLFNEFWYYVTWPLVLLGLITVSVWRRAAFFLGATSLLTILSLLQYREYALIAPYFLIWLLGVVVAILPRPLIVSFPWSASLFLLGFLADRFLMRRSFVDSGPFGIFFVDLSLAILFANLLVTMRHHGALPCPFGNQWNTLLASFSFSLYCIHTPVLMIYGAALKHYTGTGWSMAPDRAWEWWAIIFAIVLCMVSAFGLSRITEVHTDRLRRFLLQLLASLRPTGTSSKHAPEGVEV